MYQIGEECLRSKEVKGNICEQCGHCSRYFENGHIVNERSCGTCGFYFAPMSECTLKDGGHIEKFTYRGTSCPEWQDANDGCESCRLEG